MEVVEALKDISQIEAMKKVFKRALSARLSFYLLLELTQD